MSSGQTLVTKLQHPLEFDTDVGVANAVAIEFGFIQMQSLYHSGILQGAFNHFAVPEWKYNDVDESYGWFTLLQADPMSVSARSGG